MQGCHQHFHLAKDAADAVLAADDDLEGALSALLRLDAALTRFGTSLPMFCI